MSTEPAARPDRRARPLPDRARLPLDPRHFDVLAGDYDRYAALVDPLGEWLTGLGLTPGRPDSRALDAGCGSGRHAVALASAYDEVLAVDLSLPLIEAARLRRPHERVDYRVGDLREVTAGDGFDLVLCLATLHHLPDLDMGLEHLRGLVRPGGTVVLADNVAPRPVPPRWSYTADAVAAFPGDARRLGPRDAWWLLRFRAGNRRLSYLLSDHYLAPAEFDRRCGAVFPGAEITDLGFARGLIWHSPADGSPGTA